VTGSPAPEFIDFNDIRLDVDPDELDALIRRRIDGCRMQTNPPAPDFSALVDDHQKGVIRTDDERIRVVGAAGTGKTQTLVNRILSRVWAGAKPERILMLTFDNASAILLREQILAATARPGQPLPAIRVTTLAAYGESLLREFFASEHRPVAPAAVRNRIARGLMSQLRAQQSTASTLLPTSIGSSFYVSLVGLLKNACFDPRSFNAAELTRFLGTTPATAEFFHPRQMAEHRREIVKGLVWIFQNYDPLLAKAGHIDFDDQRLRPVACLKASAEAREKIQSGLDEVIVDDFQDINPLDFALISAVSGKARLIVAGDDDQAIHGASGCTADYLVNCEEHCGRTFTSFELKTSHRCARTLATAAARLIDHNTGRIPKKAVAAGRGDARITVVSSATAAMEAKSLTELIRKICTDAPGLSCSDIVVLYRSNAQSLPLQLELIRKDIPCQVRSQDNIVERGELAKLLSIVRLKLDVQGGGSCDPVDAWNCIRSFYRVLPEGAEERVFNLCTGEQSFERIISHPGMADCLPAVDRAAFQDAWAGILAARTLSDVLDMVAAKFKGMGAMAGSLDEAMENGVPLGEIFGVAAGYENRPGDFVAHLGDVLGKARTVSFGRHQDGVGLLHYLRAKGRQWHTVMIAGASEGIIPRQAAPVEDERRLFYVAMTRASSNLVISSVGNACRVPVSVSRFVAEAGLGKAG